jgi:biofilm PGA synthesis N-glycosyltransferase PgaC
MNPRFVLITPVKNEERFIGQTIQSVLEQTVRPAEWVIVSDGSTDGTDDIVRSAAAANPWIKLLRVTSEGRRSFASVVFVTEAGVASLSTADFEFIGLLDADIRFPPHYFARIMREFRDYPSVGMAGGAVIDLGLSKDLLPRNRQDIPGATQFFTKECFQKLGALVPIPEGGWDALTCARARMLGYETRLITDIIVDHLKPRNVHEGGTLSRFWQLGVRDYALGYHPLFEGVKCLGRVWHRPILFGTVAWWAGYCSAWLKRRKRILPKDLLQYIRAEQVARLKKSLLFTD